ncbi:MAG: squalene/phytoene synthase family protein [Chloroflexi bacterium]|nr:squalene/phytoene synthase family protein [Chloroflexota bacterium]
MTTPFEASHALAAAITRAASLQTYYTIRLFVDRPRVADAYRAYAYFRWVDDVLDEPGSALDAPARAAFIQRQKALLDACYRRAAPGGLCAEERMLADLAANDPEKNSGLQIYLRNMMDVMLFDAARRGRLVSQAELDEYTRKLAVAVTEALHYFIGHDDPTSFHPNRYLAVTGAHVIHMLRDAVEDVQAGYINIPAEALAARGIAPHEVNSPAHRQWVCSRIELARGCFQAGRECTAQVRSLLLRLAGYAYTARFEWMLRAIQRDGYRLRADYPQRKSLSAALWMAWRVLIGLLAMPQGKLPAAARLSHP